jgi:hypothetical protein
MVDAYQPEARSRTLPCDGVFAGAIQAVPATSAKPVPAIGPAGHGGVARRAPSKFSVG